MESHGRCSDSIIGATKKELCGYIHPHTSKKCKNESDVNTNVHSENVQPEERTEGESD